MPQLNHFGRGRLQKRVEIAQTGKTKRSNLPACFVAYQQFPLVALLWRVGPPMHSTCHPHHGLCHCVWSLLNRPHTQPHLNLLSNLFQQLHLGAAISQTFHLQYYLEQILVNSQVQRFVPVEGNKMRLNEWTSVSLR